MKCLVVCKVNISQQYLSELFRRLAIWAFPFRVRQHGVEIERLREKSGRILCLFLNLADTAWEPWILFMLDAARETARWTTEKIKAIRALLENTADKIRRDAPKTYSRELAELIFVQPYCRIANLVETGIAQRQSTSVYLKRLGEIGVLEERKVGREKLFINPAFLRLLTSAED